MTDPKRQTNAQGKATDWCYPIANKSGGWTLYGTLIITGPKTVTLDTGNEQYPLTIGNHTAVDLLQRTRGKHQDAYPQIHIMAEGDGKPTRLMAIYHGQMMVDRLSLKIAQDQPDLMAMLAWAHDAQTYTSARQEWTSGGSSWSGFVESGIISLNTKLSFNPLVQITNRKIAFLGMIPQSVASILPLPLAKIIAHPLIDQSAIATHIYKEDEIDPFTYIEYEDELVPLRDIFGEANPLRAPKSDKQPKEI